MLFDTHCHLNFGDFKEDLEEVIKRASGVGVEFMLNVGCDLKTSRQVLELSKEKNCFFAAIGIHPHFSADVDSEVWDEFQKLARNDIVAVGECGLDYYRDLSPRERQKEVFIKQLELAHELNVPVVLHSREAEGDLISILKDCDVKRAVAHCFSGSRKYLDFCLERNFYISFAGNITYPKAKDLRDIAQSVPLDLLLLETDCPFLSPQAARGKRCEPQYLTHIRDELSRLKSVSPQEIEESTASNALRCFGISL